MLRTVLTIGLLLFVADFGRLAAQSFPLDPTPKTPAKKSTTVPGGITMGPLSPRKNDLTENETEKDAEEMGGGLGNPGFTPNFGGSLFRPKMSRDEILRARQAEAWRRRTELESQEQMLLYRQRVRDEVEAVLRNLRTDLFGELDEMPVNLRKTQAVDKSKGVSEKKETENRMIARPSSPSTPMRSDRSTPGSRPGLGNRPTSGEQPTPNDRPKTEDEIFEADIRKKKAEIEQIENAEERQRQKEFLQQREESRRKFLERRAEAEKGAAFFAVAPELRLSEQQLKTGWCNLFDGETFFGWRTQKEGPYGGGRFFIKDNMICSDPESPGLLYTTNQFGDAAFHLEYQAEELSEVFLLVRTSPNPTDLNSSCYAVVLNSADFMRPRGTILGRQTLSVEQLQKQQRDANAAPAADKVVPGNRWRNLSAQFDGGAFRVMIDKEEAITVYDMKPPGCGYLGILVTKGTAKFRNMKWSPGSSISLFDGVAPTPEWRFREGAVQWTTTRDVTLQLTGGPGIVETKRNFDNFVLQFEYNITFSSGRSGLFFRSTPREDKTGYEISIQNFPTKEDRQSTIGVDVGSFRGVKKGRYLRPDDQKWNYFTLVAVDRHFQTWVNGIPVCEWSVPVDQALTTSGTIQILAPTPQTNVQFRNIRFTPIKPRNERPRTFGDRMQTTYTELNEQRKAADREKLLDEEMKKGTGSKEPLR